MQRVRILVADDHALVRAGIRRIVQEAFPDAGVEEAGNGAEVMSKLRASEWSLVLLDIGFPDRSGLDLLADVKARCPHLPVLIVSMHSERQFAVRGLRAGANGYVTKERAPEELVDAIEKVLAGHRYVSASLAELLAEDVATRRSGLAHESLSQREFEVFRQLASGRSVTEIADALALSVKTVSTYRARILEKLGVGSNAELAQYALRHELIG